MYVRDNVHEVTWLLTGTRFFDNTRDATSFEREVSTWEVALHSLCKNRAVYSLLFTFGNEFFVSLRINHVVSRHNHHGAFSNFWQRAQESPAHTERQVLLLNQLQLGEEFLCRSQVMSTAHHDDLLHSPFLQALHLVLEQAFAQNREQRFFLERPKPLGLPGEEEKSLHLA